MIRKIIFILFILFFNNQLIAEENVMILKLKQGEVIIKLFSDVAPNHVERFNY